MATKVQDKGGRRFVSQLVRSPKGKVVEVDRTEVSATDDAELLGVAETQIEKWRDPGLRRGS